eukprot:Sspe_Gene.61762::Locus_34378_Transcript_1_1_Confidence_1.000_Length_911::g.61762::m.61762/K06630/YWHAE; 14-3-3 protein epsilon
MSSRLDLYHQALVAEATGRYRHMATLLREVAEMDVELSTDERTALSIAYHRAMLVPLDSARRIANLLASAPTRPDLERVEGPLKEMRDRLLREVHNMCSEITHLIHNHLLPAAGCPSSTVFYKKWNADVLRLLVETTPCEDLKRTYRTTAQKCYDEAYTAALQALLPHNPIRLATALHYAIYLGEVLEDAERATEVAKSALEDAAAEWSASLRHSRETLVLIHSLNSNLKIWRSEIGEAPAEDLVPPWYSDTESSVEEQDRPPLKVGGTMRDMLVRSR